MLICISANHILLHFRCVSFLSRVKMNSKKLACSQYMYKTNSRKELRRNCSPIGHNIIQSIFCAQSGAGICLNFWKSFGESRYPGALPPLLENFRLAFSPDSTDCPWVSEDGEAMEVYLRVLKESNKSKFDGYHVRNSVYPILPFGIVACTFSRTTFLEIAVYTVNRYIFD